MPPQKKPTPPQKKPTFVKLKPRNPKPTSEPTAKAVTERTPKPIPEANPETVTETTPKPKPEATPETVNETTPEDSITIFQAVGVVTGDVNFSDDGKATLTIDNKEYQLFYANSKRLSFEALKKEIVATGKTQQRLVVYPKVMHFPKKDKDHLLAFQLVAFDKGQSTKGVSQELKDNEFQLRGLWQFLPVCRTPCISVMKNFSKERLEYIKKSELAQKVRFLKASHIPVFWKDAPIRPFRFNPKAGKDQGHPAFVQIKAKFVPQRNSFTFIEQLAPPSENAPKFLKASKEDKSELLKAKKSS